MIEKSRWEQFKEKTASSAKITDLLKKENYTEEELADARMAVCEECNSLLKITKQCKECGCFMVLKTKIKHATCPLGKWN
jgi:formate dehydrogenase maturation protein FdhE